MFKKSKLIKEIEPPTRLQVSGSTFSYISRKHAIEFFS